MNQKGFTLLELVIVLAVIGILGAVILPNFLGYTEKARIKSDLQTARIVQNAISLYKADTAKPLTDLGTQPNNILAQLKTKEYINNEPVLQSSGTGWTIDGETLKLHVDSALFVKLTEQEKTLAVSKTS